MITLQSELIYHLSVGFVSRSTGRSAVQSAAYITGSALQESRRNLKANYTKSHRDIAYSATLAPEHAPAFYHDLTVWDRLESFEDLYAHQYFKSDLTRERYLSSAQTAMTIVLALPKELSMEVSKELVQDIMAIKKVFIKMLRQVSLEMSSPSFKISWEAHPKERSSGLEPGVDLKHPFQNNRAP